MMKAAAPRIGGVICPPVEATDSTAAEKRGEYPVLIIIGMVNVPEATTLAEELPEIIPNSALPMTATLAGPPRVPPARPSARSMKNCPAPVLARKELNRKNRNTKDAAVASGVLSIASMPTR